MGTSRYTNPSRPKSGSWEGVYDSETLQTLHTLGIKTETEMFNRKVDTYYGCYAKDDRPTLAQWCREHPTGQFLIAAGHHMLAYRDGVIIDNGSWASRDGIHWSGMGKGKRARMTIAIKLADVNWFENQDQIQPPSWAIAAGKALAKHREDQGSRYAKIPVGRILTIKAEHERRIAEEKRLAEEARKRRVEALKAEIKKIADAKSCDRCGCATKTLRRKLCLRATPSLGGTGNSAARSARWTAALRLPRRRAAAGIAGGSTRTTERHERKRGITP